MTKSVSYALLPPALLVLAHRALAAPRPSRCRGSPVAAERRRARAHARHLDPGRARPRPHRCRQRARPASAPRAGPTCAGCSPTSGSTTCRGSRPRSPRWRTTSATRLPGLDRARLGRVRLARGQVRRHRLPRARRCSPRSSASRRRSRSGARRRRSTSASLAFLALDRGRAARRSALVRLPRARGRQPLHAGPLHLPARRADGLRAGGRRVARSAGALPRPLRSARRSAACSSSTCSRSGSCWSASMRSASRALLGVLVAGLLALLAFGLLKGSSLVYTLGVAPQGPVAKLAAGQPRLPGRDRAPRRRAATTASGSTRAARAGARPRST